MNAGEDHMLSVERDARLDVETITLARMERANALGTPLVERLIAEMTRIAEIQHSTGRQQVVRFRSQHRAFSAGFDLGEAETQSEGDILLRLVRIETLLQRLRRGPVASIAMVQGAAYGAGADLAISCTWRIGTPKARFRFPGFGFGVALGTRHLAAIVGADMARRILIENRIVGADEALDCGLLTHLVQEDELEDTTASLSQLPVPFPDGAVARILGMTGRMSEDQDLADMVRSLAEPGLKDRLAAYQKANAK